jgi:AcrR family transcriptional regulator
MMNMPVRMSPEKRLAQIAAAATRVFGRLGYQRTHMADVAAAAGLSSGALYTYVESKEALFHLVFARVWGAPLSEEPKLPLVAPPFDETLEVIRAGLRRSLATPQLRAAIDSPAPADVRAELLGIVAERYDTIELSWPLMAVIERGAVDLPALDEFYFQRGRRSYLAQLTRYVEQRSATGHFRASYEPSVAARAVTEVITWFAWHRHEDRDAAMYRDDQARRTVVQFVCAALLDGRG